MTGGAGPVQVGFFSFTEITDPEGHRAYNEWHQLDHLPEQFLVPGVRFGCRWVRTPACRSARALEVEDPLLARAHYVTLYLLAGPVRRSLEEFGELGQTLRAADRFFAHRRAVLSGPLAVEAVAAAPRVQVSAGAAPYRPARGIYLSVQTPAGRSRLDPEHLEPLVGLPGVAGAWSFRAEPALGDLRWQPGDHRITVCFLDAEPLEVAGSLRGPHMSLSAQMGAPLRLGGPFAAIIPWEWDWFERDADGS